MGRGISSGTIGIVVIALLAGLVGVYVVRTSLLKDPELAVVDPDKVLVPLASSDLPAGRVVALGDIALVNMSRDKMRADGIGGIETMLAPDQIIGRVLRESLRQGQPFRTTDLHLQGTRGDYLIGLKPGFRAVGFSIPRSKGGMLPKGTIVDVMFKSEEKEAERGLRAIPAVTLQLVQAVEIIDNYEPRVATPPGGGGTRVNLGSSSPPTIPYVTMAVTPDQAQTLQTVEGRGEMYLVARPVDERKNASNDLKPKTFDDVLGLKAPPQIVVFGTEQYRRGQRSFSAFRNDRLVEELSSQPAPVPTSNPVPAVDPLAPVAPAPVPVPVNPAPVVPAPALPVPPPYLPPPAPATGLPAPVPAPMAPVPAGPAPAVPGVRG